MTHILVDLSNLFWRGRHAVKGDADLKIGMTLHAMFNSIRKVWNDFDGEHIVVALEGRSWRKDFYKPYKANRAALKESMTEKEKEEDALFWETYNDLTNFFIEQTNVTVLQNSRLEADDLIAGWIQYYPTKKHVIISTDSDFVQLISENVSQYNGVMDYHITHTGYFDSKGKPLKDKNGNTKSPIEPEWELFEKIIRGDSSDNIFSAYPGARIKGTKHRVGIREAFDDRNKKGYLWNNFMLQKFIHHDGTEHRVLNDYERNRTLIDLTAQPEDIRKIINETIESNSIQKNNPQVGIRLMKFCKTYEMNKIIENIHQYAPAFQAGFK